MGDLPASSPWLGGVGKTLQVWRTKSRAFVVTALFGELPEPSQSLPAHLNSSESFSLGCTLVESNAKSHQLLVCCCSMVIAKHCVGFPSYAKDVEDEEDDGERVPATNGGLPASPDFKMILRSACLLPQ